MTILDEAAELINGQRAQTYGPVAENFGRIAALWSSVRGQYFSKHDVAVFMILVKVARQHDLYHRDSMVDIAGYAALDEKIYDDPPEETVDGIPVPRVWTDLYEVPLSTVVKDAEGYFWRHFDGQWHRGKPGRAWTRASTLDRPDETPFTEVLDLEPEGSE